MSQQQLVANSGFQKTLARAKAENLLIGTIKTTGEKFNGLTSTRHNGNRYPIIVCGQHLDCR